MRVTQYSPADGETAGAVTGEPADEAAELTLMVGWLKTLSPETRRLLEAVSVLGRPFTLHEAAALVERPVADLVPATGEAIDEGVLVERGPELAFRHDLVRDVLYDGLPGPVRAALHREAARVAETERRGPAEMAGHLMRSGNPASGRAVAVLRESAARATPRAPGVAADLLLASLELIEDKDPRRAPVMAEAVRLLAKAGRTGEAQRIAEDAFGLPMGPPDEAELRLALAEALGQAGEATAAGECARQALALPAIGEPTRARLLAERAHGLLSLHDVETADGLATHAVKTGTLSRAHDAVVSGTLARSVAARGKGRLGEAIRLAREAVRLADREGGPCGPRDPRLWLGRALAAADRFDEAEAVYLAGQVDRPGPAWSRPLWHWHRADLLLAAGRLAEAKATAEAGLAEAIAEAALSTSGDPAPETGCVALRGLLSQVAVREDDFDEARVQLGMARRHGGIEGDAGWLAWPSARYREAAGHPAEALAGLNGACAALPLVLTADPGASAALVRVAIKAGDTGRARTVAATARRLAEGNPEIASYQAAAAHAEGLLSGQLGTLREAIRHYRSSPRRLDAASAMEDTARAEYSHGHRGRALQLREEALRMYEVCGADRDRRRVRKALRSVGKPRPVSPLRPETAGLWDSLTESEMRVVRLVAEGLTNREVASRLYLSPHTVDSHLRHVFTKLDVHSRVALTRHFASRES